MVSIINLLIPLKIKSMAIRLRRLWVNLDDDQNLILLNRPRVSFEIDQYVWNIIEQGIVIPNGIMKSEKHDYVLVNYQFIDCLFQKKFSMIQ